MIRLKQALPVLGGLTILGLFTVSLIIIQRQLAEVHLEQILAEVANLQTSSIVMAMCSVFFSYLILTLLDWVAFRGISTEVRYKQIASAAFMGYAVSQNLGFAAVTGSAIRARLLQRSGLDGASLAAGLARTYSFFWLGSILSLGLALILDAQGLELEVGGSGFTYRLFGIIMLSVLAFILWACAFRRSSLRLGVFEFSLPTVTEAALATILAGLDWIACSAVLYSLVPTIPLSFLHFFPLFVFSQLVGVISHVPGGLGVFEGVFLSGLGSTGHTPVVVGALVLYRLVYYIIPLVLAALGLLISEAWQLAPVVQPFTKRSTKVLFSITPFLSATLCFGAGLVVLTSGATPGIDQRLLWINAIIPLSIIEISHLVSSVLGITLVILSRGLWLRIHSAYVGIFSVLLAGITVSLLKGFDYEEAIILFISGAILFVARKSFYRPGNLSRIIRSPQLLLLSLGALIGTTWLVFFANKHIEYNNQLWWEFAIDTHVSRALRGLAGAFVVLLSISVSTLFSSRRKLCFAPTFEDLQNALPIIKKSPSTHGWLALLGDKDFLFSDSGLSFIMFAAQGGSLIALGDPIGETKEFAELCWNYREEADQHGLHTVFYQVGPEYLSHYVDLGLTLLKLGEEALVDVTRYNLEGGKHSSQRNMLRKMERDFVTVEIINPEQVKNIISTLQMISDNWLAQKSAGEKGFSLGRFHTSYLTETPCIIVRKNNNICAFANLWLSETKEEFSVDLMRYSEEAPKGIMEFLFLKLILWGKEQGYQHFSLGMAPLSGLQSHPLATVWHKIGSTIFKHGEHFYNFQGLRDYKQKFDPEWSPRYLASPGGFALPVVLTNITTLISGSLRGVFFK